MNSQIVLLLEPLTPNNKVNLMEITSEALARICSGCCSSYPTEISFFILQIPIQYVVLSFCATFWYLGSLFNQAVDRNNAGSGAVSFLPSFSKTNEITNLFNF